MRKPSEKIQEKIKKTKIKYIIFFVFTFFWLALGTIKLIDALNVAIAFYLIAFVNGVFAIKFLLDVKYLEHIEE